jgi:hypothetical protein
VSLKLFNPELVSFLVSAIVRISTMKISYDNIVAISNTIISILLPLITSPSLILVLDSLFKDILVTCMLPEIITYILDVEQL